MAAASGGGPPVDMCRMVRRCVEAMSRILFGTPPPRGWSIAGSIHRWYSSPLAHLPAICLTRCLPRPLPFVIPPPPWTTSPCVRGPRRYGNTSLNSARCSFVGDMPSPSRSRLVRGGIPQGILPYLTLLLPHHHPRGPLRTILVVVVVVIVRLSGAAHHVGV